MKTPKSLFLFLMLLFGVSLTYGQTKLIAYKSHSGSKQNFKSALGNDLFDTPNSNFGVAPRRYITNAKLDSVIYVDAQKTILVTSEFCMDTYKNKSKEWKAGREYVFGHALFSKKHCLDSIKNVIRTQYHFQNDVEDVVFVGYDNDKPQLPRDEHNNVIKKKFLPILGNLRTPNGGTGLMLLLTTLILALTATGIYQFRQRSLLPAR